MRVSFRAQPVVRAVALLAGYLGAMIWLTWPLAESAWSSIPAARCGRFSCLFDLHYSTWVLAYVSHALADAPTQLANANIYYPATGTLFYGPAGLGALPLFAPVFLTTANPALAINTTFLLGVALTGVAMHVVVRRWTGSELAGVVGGATVVANPWLVHGFVPTAAHWASLYCLPLIAFVAATRCGSMRSALALAPLVALQCLTDVVYVAPAVLGPLGLLALFRLLRLRAEGLRLIAAIALGILLVTPVYYAYLAVQAGNPNLTNQTYWTITEAIIPSVLPDCLLRGNTPFLITPVAMGLVALGLPALMWRRRVGATPPLPGGWVHGALWTVVGGVMAQNTVVLIGEKTFLSPIAHLTAWAPFLHAIRVPSRLGIAGLVGLGILSGVAFAEISSLIRAYVRRGILAQCMSGALAAVALHFVYAAYVANYWTDGAVPEAMPTRYQLAPVPTVPPPFLPILRSSRAPLIELPLGPGGGADAHGHARAMFHSISHWRPLLNGYSSYWPTGFPERMTEARRLPAQDALDYLVESTGLSLIWVHTQWLKPAQQAAWASPPHFGGGRYKLTLVAREGPELLFAVDPYPVSALTYD